MDLEARRNLMENLEGIEVSLIARIVKSDTYLPSTINPKSRFSGSRPYSARENSFRRHETAKIVNEYNRLRLCWDSNRLYSQGDFKSELDAARHLDNEVPASNATAIYELNDSARGLQRFACEYTLGEIKNFGLKYPPQENFGESIYLVPFYHKMSSDGSISPDLSYRDFLSDFRNHSTKGGAELASYLVQFYDRANYVGDGTESSAREILSRETSDSKVGLCCSYCRKQFSNLNVYNAHMESKRHKKAVESAERNQSTATSLDTINETLLDLIQPYIDQACANLDRKAAMSVADRELEVAAIEREREEEDQWISDDDGLHTTSSALDNFSMPLAKPLTGPEGRPIPRWLFKLQGLGAVFRCEICGKGTKFSGRKAYERHFQNRIHRWRLNQLGFTPSPALNGVATLKEAQDIQKNQRLSKTPLPIFEKEVEDDDGNALSERMYQDLKEQGLL